MLLNVTEETNIFGEKLKKDLYNPDRSKNNGEDYVKNGKLNRDTQAVSEYAASESIDIIRNMM